MKENVKTANKQDDVVEATTKNKASVGEDYFADFDFGTLEVDMGEMLKAGVHFGHQKSKKKSEDERLYLHNKKWNQCSGS